MCSIKNYKILKKSLAYLLIAALVVTSVMTAPGLRSTAYGTDVVNGGGSDDSGSVWNPATETPVLVVTGDKLVSEEPISAEDLTEGIANEKAYTLDQLQEMEQTTNDYSAVNKKNPKPGFLQKAKGVLVDDLLALSDFNEASNQTTTVEFVNDAFGAKPFKAILDNYAAIERYYFSEALTNEEGDGTPVKALLAFEESDLVVDSAVSMDGVETTALSDGDAPKLFVGQTTNDDMNGSLFNRGINLIQVGESLPSVLKITDDSAADYTRAQLLLMPRIVESYTYSTKGGDKTDFTMGIPLVELLDGYADTDTVDFISADGFDNDEITVAEIKSSANQYVLAYEKGENAETMVGIYDKAKTGDARGYLTVYKKGASPIKMVNEIVIGQGGTTPPIPSTSFYKHISYEKNSEEGKKYNIDAITGATLTVEGPGVITSVPIPVGTLEAADNSVHKGIYKDTRNTVETSRYYEGIKVVDVLAGKINQNVKPLDENVNIVFKNRLRQTVASMKLRDLKAAETPVILAYGTAMPDESNIRPFVYTNASGLDETLGNGDGCLKIVYDQEAFPDASKSKIFSSVAYIYVEESVAAPGFKHNSSPYDGVENTQYLTTFGGKALGREFNFTTEEIENLVAYDAANQVSASGLGLRKEYGLANSTFWYVNAYEGVKLWDFLKYMGLPESYSRDDKTNVTFTSWDNHITQETFTTKELANPDMFHLYEKAINDLGTDRPPVDQLIPPTGSQTTTTDAFGYPVQKGFPVLLAYGVNGYPYVKKSNLEGYKSGLGNDGGPFRVVFGKRDYFHNNGSNQLQRVQEIFVGDKVRYSTHKYNDTAKGAYQAIASDAAVALEVEVVLPNGEKEPHTYTVGQLEDLLYGKDASGNELSKAIIDARQEKGYYYYKDSKNGKIQDLFEGVNLWYLLSEEVGMQGQIGTVTFTDKEGTSTEPISLDALKTTGYNSVNGTGDLGAMVAFAKNGYPLVASSGTTPGYVGDDPNGIVGVDGKVKAVKNSDGPLMFVMPQSQTEKEANTLPSIATVKNLKKISINLELDKYAHTQGAYAPYKSQTINFTGAVKTTPLAISVENIEKKQGYMVTDVYTVSDSAIAGETTRYRGIDLYKYLNSADVAMSSQAESVTVKNEAGESVTIPILDLVNGVGNKRILLAYGANGDTTASQGDGLPLVPSEASEGYQATYQNSGGPIKLVIQSTGTDFSETKCIENVSEIEVTASNVTGWTHDYGVYKSYKDLPALCISGSEVKATKTFTVGEIEAMTNLMVQDNYKIGANGMDVQGIKLWELIRDEVGLKEGIAVPTSLIFYSPDGYDVNLTGEINRVVSTGINGKPVLVSYGMNGLPLVGGDDQSNKKPGFDAEKGNAFGPLRLAVNDNSGWCAKWLTSIVVGKGEPEKPQGKGFAIVGDGMEDDQKVYTKDALKSLGEETKNYTYQSGNLAVTDSVTGVPLIHVISEAGIDLNYNYTVNLKTTDGFEGKYALDGTNKVPTYNDISLETIEKQNYFVGYAVSGEAISDKDKNGVEAKFRIYRNFVSTVNGNVVDGSTNWLNCANNIEGIQVVDPISGKVVFAINAKNFGSDPATYTTSKEFTKKELTKLTAQEKTYQYNGKETVVEGVMLGELLKSLGIENPNTAVTITTTDRFEEGDKGANLRNISFGAITENNYMVAYKVDGQAVESVDGDGNFSYVEIYRTFDDGTAGKKGNKVKGVNGVKIDPIYNWNTYVDSSKASVSEVRNVVADPDGGVWMGTKNGLFYSTSQGAITKSYTTKNGLPVDWIYDVAPDGKGGVWATQGFDYGNLANNKGIVHIDSAGKITNYTGENTGNGLPNNFTQAIEIDSQGNLWIGSFGGLTKFNPVANTWKTYTKEDGLPALSVSVLTKDSKGGLWIGCYPDGTNGGTAAPFSGGYAYMDKAEKITTFSCDTSGEKLSPENLADYWVTGIAVDQEDGAWIVRSGAYTYLDNVGGRVDYVSPDKKTVKKYTGKDLIPDIEKRKIETEPATNNYYPEIRTVAVDAKGGIWFGTDGIGTYYGVLSKGKFTAVDSFSSKTFDWPIALIDNTYALTILSDGRVYSGGTGGLSWQLFENLNGGNSSGSGGGGEKPEVPSSYDLVINGDDIASEIGFTLEEIKAMKGNVTVTYDSLNNYGTRESKDFTGIPVETLLGKASLKDSAKSVKMIARDGYYRQFNLDSEALGIYSKDKDGNPMMLAWKEGKSEIGHLKLVVGQPNTSYINKELWVDDIVNIRVGNKTVNPGSGSSGSYAPKEEEKTSAVTDDKNAKIIADVLNKEGATEKEIAEATTKATDQVGAEMKSATSEKEIRSVTKSARAVAEMLHLAATKVTAKEESKTLAQSASSIAESAALAVTKSSNTEVKADATQATIEAAKATDQVIGNLSDASQIQSIISDLAKNTATTAGKVSDADSKKIKTVVAQVAQTGLNSIGKQSISKSNVVSANGKDSATVALKDVSSVINVLAKAATKLNETLKTDGILGKNDSLKSILTLTLPTSSSKEVSTTIQAELMEELEKQGIDQIKVMSNVGGISFNGSAFGTESKGKDVQLVASKVDATQVAKGISLSSGSVVVEFKVLLGGESISQFKESVTISIPFDLGKNQVATGLKLYYLGENGTKTQIPGAFYNEKTGTIDGLTEHFSQFAAVYESIVFQDVKEGAWYYDTVYQLVNAGLINGKSQGIFAPNDSITRAEFVQILYKKAGMPTATGNAKFKDVKGTDWYFNAVTWAAEKEIVTGAGGSFMPNKNISREDMAVILDRFEKNVEKKTLPIKNQAVIFSDEAQIWPYAKEAVSTMQKAGVINGVGNNVFAPKKNATRAEATKMIAGLL